MEVDGVVPLFLGVPGGSAGALHFRKAVTQLKIGQKTAAAKRKRGEKLSLNLTSERTEVLSWFGAGSG